MKLKIILFLVPIISFSVNAQWTLISDSVGFDHGFVDIQFVNEDTGYVVGFMHTANGVMRTFDQGNTWDTIYVDFLTGLASPYFGPRKLHFPETCTGYIVGYSDIIKTTDCGATWTVVDTADVFYNANNQRDILFMNKDTGFVGWADGGSGGIITTDGGWSWEASPGLLGARNLNSYQGEITACSGYWYEFDEISMDWIAYPPPVLTGGHFWSDCVKKNGYHIVIEDNIYAITPDSGITWLNYYVPYGVMRGIYFYNDNLGFLTGIAGGTGIVGGCRKTSDGGSTWFNTGADNLGTGMSIHFDVVQMVNDSVGFAISNDGIYKTTNAGGDGDLVEFLSIEESEISELSVYPNPVKDILSFGHKNMAFSNCYIFDSSGKLLLSKDLSDNQVDVSSLNSGTYWILVVFDKNQFRSQFVKL